MGNAGIARATKKGEDRDQQGSKLVFPVVWWMEGCEHKRM